MRLFLIMTLATNLHAAPKLIAHRGSSATAPENTLAAFQLAWEEGADGIEGDFRMSKDGRIVCIHDEDTRRTSGKKYIVAETPWERLRTVDVGTWKDKRFSGEYIPLLEEIIAIIPPGKFFFIEIKCGPEIVAPLSKALEHADRDHTILISFDPQVIRSCRSELPEFQAHLISKLEGIQKKGGEERYLKLLDETGATGIQFKHTSKVSPTFMTKLKESERLTACWTVDRASTAKRIANLGVNFITTNRPAAIRRQTAWPD